MTIIPLDIASVRGYVNSTAKAYDTGMIGTTVIPINARLTENRGTLLEGRVYIPNESAAVAPNPRINRTILYLAVFANTIPNTKEPSTPQIISTAANILLSVFVYPYGSVMKLTVAPNDVYIPYKNVKLNDKNI
jgi:hypothetical protein